MIRRLTLTLLEPEQQAERQLARVVRGAGEQSVLQWIAEAVVVGIERTCGIRVHLRSIEAGVIEGVERLGPELKRLAFPHLERLEQRHIGVKVLRAAEHIALSGVTSRDGSSIRAARSLDELNTIA